MTTSISGGLRDHEANALRNMLNGSSGAMNLDIRTGAQPTHPDTAAPGTLLARIALPQPAFVGPVSGNGTITLTGTWQVNATASGTAGYFRFWRTGDTQATSTTVPRIDGSVSLPGGGGDLILDSLSLVAGRQVRIVSATMTIPASYTSP